MSTWDNPPSPQKRISLQSILQINSSPLTIPRPIDFKCLWKKLKRDMILDFMEAHMFFFFSFHFESSKGWACDYKRKIRELVLSPLVTWFPSTGVSGLFKGFVTENLSSVVWEFWIDTFLFSVQLLLCWSIQRFSPASCCWDSCLPSPRWFYFIGSKMS